MSAASIVLVCRPAQSDEHMRALEEQGYTVTLFSRSKGDPRSLIEHPPDAFVIDLGGAPASGRDLGGFLRRQQATRHLPLVFVSESPVDDADRVRKVLPDATFSTWDDIMTNLEGALRRPPDDPVVPGAMDAYTGVRLEKKLGIRAGHQVGLLNAPKEFEKLVPQLSEGASLRRDPKSPSDVLLLFVSNREALEGSFVDAVARLAEGGRLWICWPKKSSKADSDLTQQSVREFGLERKMVDYKICSIDKTWSGLCFARRQAG